MLQILIRVSTQLYKDGDKSSGNLIYSLYDFGIQSNYLLINNSLPPVRFVNIIRAISAIRTAEQADLFLNRNISFINEEMQNETKSISLAQIKFWLTY